MDTKIKTRQKNKTARIQGKVDTQPSQVSQQPPIEKNPLYNAKLSRKNIEKALEATGGMVYLAAKQLNCNPSTLYKKIKGDESLSEFVSSKREEFLDIGESALKRAVLNGEAWAVCFLLKTLGKERGFIERAELSGRDGAPMYPLAPEQLSDKAIQVEIEKLLKKEGIKVAQN